MRHAKIDIQKLVTAIHEGDCRGLKRAFQDWDIFENTSRTYLYIIRAWHRGKIHRLNPPENMRNRNRERGLAADHGWDAEAYAKKIWDMYSRNFAFEDEVRPTG